MAGFHRSVRAGVLTLLVGGAGILFLTQILRKVVKTAYEKAGTSCSVLPPGHRVLGGPPTPRIVAWLREFKDALTAMHAEFMESLRDRIQSVMKEMIQPLQDKIQECGDVQAGFASVAQSRFTELLKAVAECNDAIKGLHKTVKTMQEDELEKLQDLKGLLAEFSGQQDNLRITATTVAGTTNRLMREFEAFKEAVKNSFQDLGVADGGFHDKLNAWFGGFESFKANLHELLQRCCP